MAVSELKLIKRCVEFCDVDEIQQIPYNTRGIYVLFKKSRRKGEDRYDVVYIGMTRGPKSGARGRLSAHERSEKKKGKWTHFSLFEVWTTLRRPKFPNWRAFSATSTERTPGQIH